MVECCTAQRPQPTATDQRGEGERGGKANGVDDDAGGWYMGAIQDAVQDVVQDCDSSFNDCYLAAGRNFSKPHFHVCSASSASGIWTLLLIYSG